MDVELEADASFPRGDFVEPKYTDAPHEGEGTDDHSPSSVHGGQQLRRDVYTSQVASKCWDNAIFVITYDERGGLGITSSRSNSRQLRPATGSRFSKRRACACPD